MPLTKIPVACAKCGKVNHRWTNTIHPNKFGSPEKAKLLSVFWCCACEKPNAVYYKFEVVDGAVTVSVGEHVEPADYMVPQTNNRAITVRCKQRSSKGN